MTAMPSELEAVRAMLRRARTARLATITPSGRATVAPFWFAFHEDRLFLVADDNATVANIRRDPRVSLLVDFGTSYADLHGAIVQGHAEAHAPDTAPPWVRDGIAAYSHKYASLEDERLSLQSLDHRRPRERWYVAITPRRARWFSVGGFFQGSLDWTSESEAAASSKRIGESEQA
jgi:rhamnose utilization protein RhaD (predicted bifunctional aldolase and dehydrogenase)